MYGYPHGLRYLMDRDPAHWVQLHETKRTLGGYVHVEAGRPALKAGFVAWLDGVPHEAVELAMDCLQAHEPTLWHVLAWHQGHGDGAPLEAAAEAMGCCPGTLRRRLGEAIAFIRGYLEEAGYRV